MKSKPVFIVLALILTAAGIYTSKSLLLKHMRVPGGPAWLDSLCESGDSGNISCDKVLASRWGMFPPAAEGETEKKRQFPVALLGMAYFTALFVWYLAVGRSNRAGRYWHLAPLMLNLGGLAGSISFIKVMALDLQTWCPLCLATHVINILLFVVNLLLWPRVPRSPAESAEQSPTPTPTPPAHPTLRLALVTFVLALAIGQLETKWLEVSVIKGRYKKMADVVSDIQGSVSTLVTFHLARDAKIIDVRPDDPIRYMPEQAPTIVVWSDFECGHCRSFARNFEEKYAAHFDGFLRLVYKHYPVCSDCNPNVGRCAHPTACDAAQLSEAVRQLAGNDAFWEVHDLLFDAQESHVEVSVARVAGRFNLDPQVLTEAMSSDQVQQRIDEDIEHARRIGVHSTPAVFLERREVNNLTREVDGFWRSIGAKFQTIRSAQQRANNQKPE